MTSGVHWPAFPSQRRPRRTAPSQAGAATLAVTVIMLLVVSVLVFHSYAASWLEQRATTNQTRAKQAHAAAEAGLDVALSVLNADTAAPGNDSRDTLLTADATQPGRFTIANANLTDSPGAGLAYAVTLGLVPGDAEPVARLLLTSIGGSDCTDVTSVATCSGQARVQQVVEATPILRNAAASPVSFEAVFGASEATIRSLTTPVTSVTPFFLPFYTGSYGLIWHQGDLVLTNNLGMVNKPVLLVVDGNLTMTPPSAFFGFVYVTGNANCPACSYASFLGAIAVEGTNTLPPDPFPNLTMNAQVLNNLRSNAVRFTKVIGTWRDW